jgi:hypothetical protein
MTNPNNIGILANGIGIVLDHCVFYNLKQPVVYWTGGSTGHAMRSCLVYGSYGCGIWTSRIANDVDYRNNVVANSNYVWIGQTGASAPREAVHYKVADSLFAGNKKLTGSGGGPALNFKDVDPSFLELVRTKVSPEPVTRELDQTKRNHLHPVEGSEAAAVGAGLFTRKP